MAKSKIGLQSVNITLHYDDKHTGRFTGLHCKVARTLKRQFYMVSLEGLDSCTLLLDSLLFTNVVERVTGRKL